MLSYFPNLYPDELLYSCFARYHDHSSNISSKKTMQELFGKSSSVAVVDLPSNLNVFYENINHFNPPKINDVINEHTLYKYYTSFQKSLMKKRAIEYIKYGGKPGAIHMFLGISASTIKDWQYLRFCSSCVKQDRERYGESYWHVSHQLPRVYYCHLHQELLHDSNIKLRNPHKHEYISAERADLSLPHLINLYSEKTNQYLKKLSVESVNLISFKYTIETTDLQKICKYLMQINGYANHLGKVHQKYFTQRFKQYYGSEFLALVDCDFDEHSDTSWLRNIVRKHRKAFHPVKHLLLFGFLNTSILDLEKLKGKKYEPFGQSPYYCLNPAADHYKRLVIEDVTITTCTNTGKPVGTFTCDCGFVYSRCGPDIDGNDVYKIGRIKTFGDTWIATLRELVVSGLSYYRIAQILNCDYATVKRYSEKKKVNQPECSLSMPVVKIENEKEWLNLLNINPTLTITRLRSIAPALYGWHYRNNRDWLEKNSPKSKKPSRVNNRVDWDERDKKILGKVKSTIKELYASEKPVYVNKSRVGKNIGYLSLIEKKLDKLPQTKEYLEKNLETREQYQIRRIKWSYRSTYKENEVNISEWKIKRLAGINKDLSPVLKEALYEECNIKRELNVDEKLF